MINLLPNDYKKTIHYSRRNRTVSKWISALLVSLFLSLFVVAMGWVYLDQSVKRESRSAAQTEASLKAQNIDDVTSKVEEISSNTKLVLQVLSKEVLFSKLIRQLGASLPSNTALESIEIEDLKGGLTIRASAKDFNSASQIQVNLEDPQNKIFKQADIESITCNDGSTDAPASTSTGEESVYPCSVQLKALFADNNPYIYIGGKND